MPFLLSSTIKPIFLSMPVLLIPFLLLLISQVSVAEGDYCKEYYSYKNDTFTIAVPGKASFKTFVNITRSSKDPDQKNYSGYCIDVFKEALENSGCDLPYEFVEFNGTYDELVKNVTNKTYSAAVGDITILADRWEDVEFTVPFTESGLTLVVPVRPGPKAWIFLAPFTLGTWLTIGVVLVYTMFTVWFVEHRSNPDFKGPWYDQLGNALWFTFTSLFLAHRERIQSNYARVVVVAWLFLALVLTQSYGSNLTTMLTMSRLRPRHWSRAKVGCDENTFIKKYVQDKLHYKNAITIKDEDEYLRQFETGKITAAFLESPYAKVFINKHCGNFTGIRKTQRFGGFGFVSTEHCELIFIHVSMQIFQKHYSRLAANVSKAILRLSEDGTLRDLENYWLTPNDCSESKEDAESLSLQSLLGLFLFSIGTSSVCFLLFLGHLLMNYLRDHQSSHDENENNDQSVPTRNSMQIIRNVGRYFRDADIMHPRRSPSSRARVVPEMRPVETVTAI
ncbi:hypothetical protein RHMOL_Rhmol13G0244500 [Rhododendron molle]|uniref:Uncharacterized protein n=1 Tax=Rhododendron molle TaxID=49168 RepID=A0ACC0LAN9_RHOML|nr:hypothetical protein RHMOL_Rhmol13G0244500 [Rhododendron molle]